MSEAVCLILANLCFEKPNKRKRKLQKKCHQSSTCLQFCAPIGQRHKTRRIFHIWREKAKNTSLFSGRHSTQSLTKMCITPSVGFHSKLLSKGAL